MKILDRLKATVPYLLFFFIGLIVSMVTLAYCVLTLKLGMVSSIGLQTIATTACLLPLVLGYRWLKIKRRKAENKKVMAQKIAEAEDLTPPPDPLREYPDETPPLPPELRYDFHNPHFSDEDFEKQKKQYPDLAEDLDEIREKDRKAAFLARIEASFLANVLITELHDIKSWQELLNRMEKLLTNLKDDETRYFH